LDEESEFDKELRASVAAGDSKSFEAITFRVGKIVLEEGYLPEQCFRGILVILQDEEFHRLEGSWKLIRVFEENWKELSETQRAELLPILKASYDSFHDWMACFVISGILGELYKDQRAFDALCRLKNSRKEMPRSFVPHGFERLATGSLNDDLARNALAELTKDAAGRISHGARRSSRILLKAQEKRKGSLTPESLT